MLFITFEQIINVIKHEGTQRFIWVNVYSCSSSSLLATFSEQNKDFFSKRLFYTKIMLASVSTDANISKLSLCKLMCGIIT